jgi:two-component system cell cycle sensor histidine kinase/response regulator CckA
MIRLRLPSFGESLDAETVLEALEARAALCGLDGAVLAANRMWRETFGDGRRASVLRDLFTVFVAARRDGRAAGAADWRGSTWMAAIARVGADKFLVEFRPAVPQETARGPAALDPFAAASPFGAALISGDDPFQGPMIEVNAAWRDITGGGPAGRLAHWLTARSLKDCQSAYAAGRLGPFEIEVNGAPGRTAHLHLVRNGARTIAYLRDMTDHKAMQGQLAQRNKMEAIGQLAGGVAHDFNNLLSAIRLRTDELLIRHPLGDPSFDSLAEIRQTVNRAADVVRQLLAFSRKATTQRESLELGEALSDAAVLLRRLVREDVTLDIDYGRDLPIVRIDRSQLENAVMNLVVNARDALKGRDGGRIQLRAARVAYGQAVQLGYGGLPLGDMALIEVSDDGPGIAETALAHIFEPFFTTKGPGEGTGLGLATVYGAVKQAEGWITALSPPGEGAVFRIFLPEHRPPPTLEPPPASEPRRASPRDLSGAGRILFVEDEPLVRGIAARLLRDRGYDVIEACDGEEALDLAKRHAGQIHLMISDVIMPGRDGPSLLRAARPYLGEAPVLFISGYAEAEFSELLEGEAGVSFLAKPLDIKGLAERVKAILNPETEAA